MNHIQIFIDTYPGHSSSQITATSIRKGAEIWAVGGGVGGGGRGGANICNVTAYV